jgi:hypothetical protein
VHLQHLAPRVVQCVMTTKPVPSAVACVPCWLLLQCADSYLCHLFAAVRHAQSASSADFASALSPSVRTSGDNGSATGGTAGAGERESFLSRSAALLKKGGLRRHTERGGASQRQASSLSTANVRTD